MNIIRIVFKTYFFIHMPTVVQKNWLRFPPIIHQILMTIRHSYYIVNDSYLYTYYKTTEQSKNKVCSNSKNKLKY
jgi:hypothetical protein